MFEQLIEMAREHWQWLALTVLDVLIVYYIIYRLLLLLRGTKAFRALVGLVFIIALFLASQYLGLVTTNWLLNGFFNSLIILVILIFHQDIRSALSRVGRNPFTQTITTIEESKLIDEVVKASAALSRTKTGGLIIFEREAKLIDPAETAIEIDARFSRDLVQSIAHTSSPIHDGAILLRNGRLSHASVFLPLSTNPRLGRHLGTRHRAAIGITEETDAVVIVISEETGKISLAMEGKITRDLDPEVLKQILQNTLGRTRGPSMRRLFKSRAKSRVAPAQPSRQARETPPTIGRGSVTPAVNSANKHEMETLTGLPAGTAKDKDNVVN